MSPPRPVGRLHTLQGWTLEVVFSTGSELLFGLGNIGSLGLLLSPTPFAEDCEVHRPCLGLRSSQRQTLKCLGEHALWTGEDVLPVRMILFHLRGSLATRYRVKMQLVTQYLPCDSKDQVYRKRSVSVGGASLSSQASSGWSPEKGCSLRNKEEGGEGLSRPLRAYPISSYLPGLWHPPGLRFIARVLPKPTRGGQGHRGSSPQNYNTQNPWTVRGGSLVGVEPKN